MSAAASARSAASPVEGGAQAARNADVRVSSGSGRTGERHRGRPGVLAVLVGQPLRRAVGQEAGVHLAVMTDRHRPLPQMNHLDAVRLAALALALVVVVPAVRGGSRTGGHLSGGHLSSDPRRARCTLALGPCLVHLLVRVAQVPLLSVQALGRVCAVWRACVLSVLVSVRSHPLHRSSRVPVWS